MDYSTLEKIFLVCSDNNDNSDILVSNLAKQVTDKNDKSVIFDTTGSVVAENKLIFGKDFKLPLNYNSINFIYEHDLNDVDATGKAIIQDILLEVQEYANTVLDKFIPFDSFINVIDQQYKLLKLPELVLLKNRLMRYKEDQVFAQNAHDMQVFRATVRANLSTLIDISCVDPIIQNLIINTLYDELNKLDLFVYSFVKIDNDNADKKLLRTLLNQGKIYTTIICAHNFKYLYELKERANNMILFAPQTTQHDFNSYNVFLNKLNQDEFIVCGKSTQNIPLIIENLTLEDLSEYEQEFALNIESPKDDTSIADAGNLQNDEQSFDIESNPLSEEAISEDKPVIESFDEVISQEDTEGFETAEAEAESKVDLLDKENSELLELNMEEATNESSSVTDNVNQEASLDVEPLTYAQDENAEGSEIYDIFSTEENVREDFQELSAEDNSVELPKESPEAPLQAETDISMELFEPIEDTENDNFIDLPSSELAVKDDDDFTETMENNPEGSDFEFFENTEEQEVRGEHALNDEESINFVEENAVNEITPEITENLTEDDLDFIDNLNETVSNVEDTDLRTNSLSLSEEPTEHPSFDEELNTDFTQGTNLSEEENTPVGGPGRLCPLRSGGGTAGHRGPPADPGGRGDRPPSDPGPHPDPVCGGL